LVLNGLDNSVNSLPTLEKQPSLNDFGHLKFMARGFDEEWIKTLEVPPTRLKSLPFDGLDSGKLPVYVGF